MPPLTPLLSLFLFVYQMPNLSPVNRFRELETVLKTTLRNWSAAGEANVNVSALIFSQSQGIGKTYFLEQWTWEPASHMPRLRWML